MTQVSRAELISCEPSLTSLCSCRAWGTIEGGSSAFQHRQSRTGGNTTPRARGMQSSAKKPEPYRYPTRTRLDRRLLLQLAVCSVLLAISEAGAHGSAQQAQSQPSASPLSLYSSPPPPGPAAYKPPSDADLKKCAPLANKRSLLNAKSFNKVFTQLLRR